MHGTLPLPGDVVWIRRRRWRVDRVVRNRHVVRLDVTARDQRLTFLSPFDRVAQQTRAPRPRRVRMQHALATLAARLAARDDLRIPLAAVGANAEILPHQIEPALAMLSGRTRILIADDVGLGKTVQAGLVLAELLRTHQARRVLIIAPAALRDQWSDELSARFRIECTRADRAGLDEAARQGAYGENPWSQSGVWIASPDFLKQPHIADSLAPDVWDLVIIDEAHNVCGDSERYTLCQRVTRRSRRVLLLTATPHTGDTVRFSRLIELGRTGPRDSITIFRRTRASVGSTPPRRVRWHRVRLAESEVRVFETLRAFERAVTSRGLSDQVLLLLSIFRKRALSTMSALSISITRRLGWLGEPGTIDLPDWAQPRLSFGDDAELEDEDERAGLMASTGLASQHERSWLRRLRTLADEASRTETKVERLAALVHRLPEPVVVFTEYRDSLDVIRRRLSFGRQVAVLHGGLDFGERRTQLRQFLHGEASVLLATDVAGQGLNLQSRARWVISLELPWNPARLEQRIGRVDRISQTRPTHLTLMVARDDAESGLLAHLARRVLSARQAIGADTLAGIAPPEADVRAALILGRPLADAASPGLKTRGSDSCVTSPGLKTWGSISSHRPTRQWVRSARVAAHMLLRRRACGRMMRGHFPQSSRPLIAHSGSAVRVIGRTGGSLFVFSVPILGADDSLIARHVVSLQMATPVDRPGCAIQRATLAEMHPCVLRSVRRAVARIRARLRRVASSLLARERAIAMVFERDATLTEAQPGLFDRRAMDDFDDRSVEQNRLREDAIDRISALEHADVIRVGEPQLEFVISSPGRSS